MVPSSLVTGSYAYGYLWAPWAHPQVGRGLGGRVSLLCPKGGPETSPCIAGRWVRAQDPSAPLPLPGQCPCQIDQPCRALMERAGHWGAQRRRGSRCCCPPCGLASHAPEVGRVAGTPTVGISPTQAAKYCVWPLSPQGGKFK